MDKILTKQAGIEYLHEVTSVFQPFELVSTQHLELFRVVSAQNFPEAVPCCSWCVEMTSPGIPCSFLAPSTLMGKNPQDASVKGFVGICQHNLRFSTWGVVCRFVNPFHKLIPSSLNHFTQHSPKIAVRQTTPKTKVLLPIYVWSMFHSHIFPNLNLSLGAFEATGASPPCLRLRVFQLFHLCILRSLLRLG